MDQDRAKRMSRIPQLTPKPKPTRRAEPSRQSDSLRPKPAAKPAVPVRSKPASRLGSTASKQGSVMGRLGSGSPQGSPMARRTSSTSARDVPTASVAQTSREGPLQRKTTPVRDVLTGRQGLQGRQTTAASTSKASTARIGTGLMAKSTPSRPSSAASNRSSGSASVGNRWNASVARSPSATARLGSSAKEGLPLRTGRLGLSREPVLTKKATPVRDITGARLQSSVKETIGSRTGSAARQASIGKQETGLRHTIGLRRTSGRLGESSSAGAQPSEGVRKSSSGGIGQSTHDSVLPQRSPALRRVQQVSQQDRGRVLSEDKDTASLRRSTKVQEPPKESVFPGRMDDHEPKVNPRHQGMAALRSASAARAQGSSHPRDVPFRSRLTQPLGSDEFRSMLSSPSGSSRRSPDRSSSFSAEEFSDISEQPPASAGLMRNTSNPFISEQGDANFSFGSTPSKAPDQDRRPSSRGRPLSAQLLASRYAAEPSALLDLDAESSFTGSERSHERSTFSPTGRLGEEELRRQGYHGRRVSEDSEGGFSEELAARQDSLMSFGRDSIPSTFEDSDDEVPTGRRSAGQNSTHSCATSELSFKDMNTSPRSVDSLEGSRDASSDNTSPRTPTEHRSASRGERSRPFVSSPLKSRSMGPGGNERPSSRSSISSRASRQGEGTSKAGLLNSGSGGSPLAPEVTSLHLELESALRHAEQEMEDLQRQVNGKNQQMQQAQKALLAYEDEVNVLQKRLQDNEKELAALAQQNGSNHGRTKSQEMVRDELKQMKSQTAQLSTGLRRLSVGSDASFSNSIDDAKFDQLRMELEALQADNRALAAQVKALEQAAAASSDEIVSDLKKELQGAQAEKAELQQGMEEVKVDKQRIQAELLQAQEELRCVLSETHDADAEVQVYLQRLEEAQNRKEMLERDLQQAEGELGSLQTENEELQARFKELEQLVEENKQLTDDNRRLKETLESEAKVKQDALEETQMAADGLARELESVRKCLNSMEEENDSLREQLANSPRATVVLRSVGEESSVISDDAGSSNVHKVAQLQEALSLSLQMNRCLKDHIAQASDRRSVSPLMDNLMEAEIETEAETMRKVKEMEEALELALEAKDLLEKKVAEHEEVHPGLERLNEEVQNLMVELEGERSRAREEQEAVQAMIQELENEKKDKMNDLQQVRQALLVAQDAKARAEEELEAERAASAELRALLDRGTAEQGREGKVEAVQDFPGRKAGRKRELSGSADLKAGLDVDSSDGSPLSAAKLRAPVEFGDEAQLRRAAIAAVSRLEELEQELSSAVKEKCDLAQQMVDISVASQELQKVVLETAQMTSEMSVSKERRAGRARTAARGGSGDDPLVGVAIKSGSAELDLDLSGASDSEDVSIPAGKLRGMRSELLRARQEKAALEAQLAERSRRSGDFSSELKGLQEELRAALAMKEELTSRFGEYEAGKARMGEEVGRLTADLEAEKRNAAAVEEAVGGLYALCKEVESSAGMDGRGRSMDDDFPSNLPDAVSHLTGRMREGICSLASRGRGGGAEGFAGREGEAPGQAAGPKGAHIKASGSVGSEQSPDIARAEEIQAQLAELQDARNQLQEVLQERAYQAANGRPGSQAGSPLAAAKQGRFGYMPSRELQRAQQMSVHQDALQRQGMDGGRWQGEQEAVAQQGPPGALQAANYKEGEIRQLQGVMRNMELEMEALRQRNEQRGGGGAQGVPGVLRGREGGYPPPPAPDNVAQRVAGLQSRAQELETHLLQVKLENAELKKAIDAVNGIARGRIR